MDFMLLRPFQDSIMIATYMFRVKIRVWNIPSGHPIRRDQIHICMARDELPKHIDAVV